MQIHELTKKKQFELEEVTLPSEWIANKAKGAAQKVGGAVSNFKGAYQDASADRKTGELFNKAYPIWKKYERQLLRTNPNARANGQLEQALLAFVNKNLLGGMYLPNVINKDKIVSLVKQISNSGAPAQQPPATQTNTASAGAATAPISKTNVAKSGNPNQPQQTPLQQATALQQQVQGQKPAATFGRVPSATAPAKPGQMPASVANSPKGKNTIKAYGKPKGGIQGMTSDLEEAIPTVKPTARPVGGLAARSAQRNAPAPVAGQPTPATPATAKPPATPAPATPAAPAPAVAPTNEKELFKQLVQQAGLAQTSAPGAGNGNATGQSTIAPGGTQGSTQDAEGMAQTLKQQLDPAIAKGLPALGATAAKLTGTKQVKSTGNPAADGLLLLMGFQGL